MKINELKKEDKKGLLKDGFKFFILNASGFVQAVCIDKKSATKWVDEFEKTDKKLNLFVKNNYKIVAI